MPQSTRGSANANSGAATRRRSPRGLSVGNDSSPGPAAATAAVAAAAAAATSRKKKAGHQNSVKESKARKQAPQDSPSSAASSGTTKSPASVPPPDTGAPSDDGQGAGNGSSAPGAATSVGSGSGSAGDDSGTAAGPMSADTGVAEDQPEGEGAAARNGASAGRSVNSRREAYAQIARSRGAHFARPDKKPDAGAARSAASGNASGARGNRRGGSAAGTGAGAGAGAADSGGGAGPKESWPGPFAEARRLLNNREAAAALRESIRVNGTAQAASGEENDSGDEGDEALPPVKVEWKPRGSGSRTGKSRVVPTLFRLCLKLLADNFDHIESLGDVSPEVRNHLAAVMCRELKLTTEALQRLCEPGVTEIILPDCSRIEPDQMRVSLSQCRQSLRVLRLGTCGRCVSDATVETLAKEGGFSRLEIASLAGTYQLTDTGVLELLSRCPRLTGMELSANSRITVKAIKKMVDAERPVGMALTSLSLADCIQLGPEELEPLKGMTCLESLSLSGLTKLTDEILLQILEACGWRLRHLDISDCTSITDASLRAVGELCGVLESFSLGNCPLLSADAVQELFMYRGSTADASKGFRAPVLPVGNPNGTGDSNGSGGASSASKGKGKGKSKEAAAAEGVASSGTTVASDANSLPGGPDEEENGDDGEAPTGHAMLKSRLTSLSLRGLSQVDDKVVAAMSAACAGSLRSLDLKGLALLTDASLVALTRYCSPSLESLDLSFCRGGTDDGIGQLVDASPNLKSLRLWGCTQVTDRFLKGHSREELSISRY